MSFYDNLLKDDEELIRVVRSFSLSFFWPFFWGLLLLIAPFLFIIPLFNLKNIGIVIFGLAVIIGFIIFIRTFIIAYFNSFIITDRRVIDWDQRGMFERVISEAEYDKIQDISYRIKGMTGTILNYGTIQIQTAGSAPVLELKYVRCPQKIQTLITDVKRNFRMTERPSNNTFKSESGINRS